MSIARIFTRRLNKKGIYISKPFNECSSNNNRIRIGVYPIGNEIKFTKTKGGFIVSGEGFVFDDDKENVKKHKAKYYTSVSSQKGISHTEVKSENELF